MIRNAALLVVNIQAALLDLCPWNKKEFMETAVSVLGACRAAGVPVVFARHEGGPGSIYEPGTDGWNMPREVAPLPGEAIIDKRYSSAFHRTDLQEHLESIGCRNLILMGMQTEFCIDATCKSAFEREFSVTIPLEGHTTLDYEHVTAATLHKLYSRDIWDGRFASVLPAAELIRGLSFGKS